MAPLTEHHPGGSTAEALELRRVEGWHVQIGLIGAGQMGADIVVQTALMSGIDATGDPNVGAEVALATIAARKHIVMMNVEADVTIGVCLAAKAAEAGVVYTLFRNVALPSSGRRACPPSA